MCSSCSFCCLRWLIASPLSKYEWLGTLLWFNAIALTLRVVQRVYFVTQLYGWEHGVLSVPRMIVGNFINFMAVSRAWKMFLTHLLTGKRLAWDKTMHDFPSEDGFTGERPRLGELLVTWQAIGQENLDQALQDAHARQAPLGRVLMAKGWLDDETLAEAIAFQADLERGALDLAQLRAHADLLPLDTVIRHRVLPQGEDAAGHVVLLVASPLPDAELAQVAAELQRDVVQRIVREGEIATGLRQLRGMSAADAGALAAHVDGTATTRGVPLLGDLLIERGHVLREIFDATLRDYSPHRDGRIGDYMVSRGVISHDALDDVIKEQHRLGGVLAAAA